MKKFFLKRKKILLTLLVIVVFFLGKYLLIDSKKTVSNFVAVRRGDIKEELTLSGQVEADDHIVLNFRTPGKVNLVAVKEDDWVKKGQIIAALDTQILDAALRQTWQNFTAAKAASDKFYDGRDPNKAESYDEKIQRTSLDAAQNVAYDNTRIAQENLDSATLYSPIDGLIIGADPSVAGVNVVGTNLGYEIVNPSTIYLKVTADQTEVGSIKKDQVGEIVFDSYPDEQITGRVKDISFTPDKNETGTVYDIKVSLNGSDNKDYKYKLGMTADITFIIKENKNALILPSQYVNSDDKGKFVLVGEDKKKQYVKTGIEGTADIEVTSGLVEGEAVYD
jgi:RND family efflux transporter MFP subunit